MKTEKGFTLIELIGVLAIIAILASAIAPNLAKEISRAMAEAEDRTLETVAESFRRSVIGQHIVPGTTTGQWDIAVGAYSSIPTQLVVQNRGTGNRRLIARPTNNLGVIPYDQVARFSVGITPQGTLPIIAPVQAKFLLVSDLAAPVTALVPNDIQFDAIWQQSGTIPNGYKQTEKVRINRISLSPYFYPVTVSCASITANPRWSIDNSGVKDITTNGFTVYLLLGTQVHLYQGVNIVSTIVVNKPIGLTYDGISWRY